MTETNDPTPVDPAPVESMPVTPPAGSVPPLPASSVPAAPAYGGVPAGVTAAGPIGKIRNPGTCVLLTIVTLGIYPLYWYYKTSDEMKQHTGEGIGGAIALVLAIFVGIVMPFLTPNEVGRLYERRGEARPVSASTGLWFLLLGWFFFIGAFVWFFKTNGALNAYWRSMGALD